MRAEKCGELKLKTDFLATYGQPERGLLAGIMRAAGEQNHMAGITSLFASQLHHMQSSAASYEAPQRLYFLVHLPSGTGLG